MLAALGLERVPVRSMALCAAALCSTLAPTRSAWCQAAPTPQRTVVRQVRLGLGADAPVRTLVLEGGRIQSILEPNAAEPPGARVVEGEDLIALPAFVDACASTWIETPQPASERDLPVPIGSDPRIDMRAANRKGVQPSFRAVSALAAPAEKTKAWREAGFGALCAGPSGQLLAGTSALVTARTAAVRDLVIDADVWMQAAFDASGPGYPSTLMGYQAQLRQLFLDAQRHAELGARWSDGRPGARPAFDAELEAAQPLLKGELRLACAAERALEIERWIALADEFGLKIAIVGGREAWRVRDELARLSIPVVLTLDWGEEVKDPHDEKPKKKDEKVEAQGAGGEAATQKPAEEQAASSKPERDYEEPLAVREEKRRQWEEGRDCALRLAEAGVSFAFGSGDESAAELAKKVRTLVEEGLAQDTALAALTSQAAAILGAERQLGALEPGRDATLCLWTKNPFEKGAKLAWVFVDGFAHELDVDEQEDEGAPPDEGVDASGTWALTSRGEGGEERTGQAVLTMEKDGAVTGTLTVKEGEGQELECEVEGRVSGKKLDLSGTFHVGEMAIEFALEAELAGDAFSGDTTSKGPFGEMKATIEGVREPKRSRGGQR